MKLLSILQVREGEARMVALLSLFFALVEIGRGIGGNAADGLFFVRFGVENLPWMYAILGAVTFLVMIVYTTGVGRFDKGIFFAGLLGVLAIVLLLERAAILTGLTWLYPFLWVSVNSINQMLGTMMWTTASEVCDTRQAKRLFSLFTSAGILGGVAGNFLTGPLARVIGTENLIIVFAVLMGACTVIVRGLATRFFKPKSAKSSRLLGEISVGFDFVRNSPLLILLAIASVLFSILYFSLTFPFNRVVSASFPTEAEVAGFLGLFSGVATAITFLVSLFVANRLYNRIGIVNSVLLLPLTYLIGFVLFVINNSLPVGIVARLAQLVVLGGIASSAYATFYNVVPADKRGQVQSFDAGVTSQIGIVLSGVLLLATDRFSNATTIFVLGMIVAVIDTIVIWKMRRAYGEALVKALREGLLDVFTSAAHGYQHLGRDSHAVQVAIAGLADPKDTVRRVSAEVLGKMRVPAAIGPLTTTLQDSDPDVRIAALDGLAVLDNRESAGAIEASLHDPDARVRSAAIKTIATLAPGSLDIFERAADDENPRVRAEAAIALSHGGKPDLASQVINTLIHSEQVADQVAGLDAVAEVADGVDEASITRGLKSSNSAIRRAAVRALTQSRNPAAHRSLALALDDPDARVRDRASEALTDPRVDLQVLREVLNHGSSRAQQAALYAFKKRGHVAHSLVYEWVLAQIPQARQLRTWNNVLHQAKDSDNSRAIGYLHVLLHQREWQIEQRILEALALEDSSDALDLIAKGLESRSKERRAQALEALDTIANKKIARGLIPLLEETGEETTQKDVRPVLQTLTSHPDRWVRALAVYAIGDMLSRDLAGLIAQAKQDPDEIVREAAGAFVNKSAMVTGGMMPETLKTLGTMDRILFLRQVPLFENLDPDDLESIAELAREKVFGPGEFLCRESEVGDELFVIVSGSVRVEKHVEGTMKTLRRMEAGSHIGELAVLREQPRSANVVAEGAGVRTLVLSGEAVRSILRERPEVAMAMLTSLAERLSTTS